MAIFNTLFRSGRTTPTNPPPANINININEPLTPISSTASPARPAPPSSFKHPLPAPPPGVVNASPQRSPSPIKVKDYVVSNPKTRREACIPGPARDRPLPPIPSESPHEDRPSRPATWDNSTCASPRRVLGPPVAFTPPRHHHHRTASGPSPLNTHPSIRQRSVTLQQITATPPPRSPASAVDHNSPPRVDDNDWPSTSFDYPRSNMPSNAPPSPRRRPVALKLRTSNLTSHERSSPRPNPLLRYLRHKPVVLVDAPPKDESRGEPLESIEHLCSEYADKGTPTRTSSVTVSKPAFNERRRSRSTSDIPSAGHQKTKTRQPGQSQQAPTPSENPKHRPFECVPLPWSSTPASQLSADMGQRRFDTLVQYTLHHLSSSPPRLLPPCTLKTSASEDARLRIELVCLCEKYDAVIRHRDQLLADLSQGAIKAEAGATRGAFDDLRKAMNRCDRIARQVYICNDQIHQIEIQGEEHVVGALRVALGKSVKEEEEEREEEDSPLSSGSDTLDTDDGSPSSCVTSSSPFKSPRIATDLSASIESRRLVFLQTLASSPRSRDVPNDSRPTSTSAFLSIDHLRFPLPPSRDDPRVSPTPIPGHPSIHTDRPEPPANRSASTSQLVIHVEEDLEEIVIFPTGHRRSISAPLPLLGDVHLSSREGPMYLPHTPWRGQHEQSKVAGSTAPSRVKASTRKDVTESQSLDYHETPVDSDTSKTR